MLQVSEPSENSVGSEFSGMSNIFGIVGTIFMIGKIGIFGMSRFFGTTYTIVLLSWFCSWFWSLLLYEYTSTYVYSKTLR